LLTKVQSVDQRMRLGTLSTPVANPLTGTCHWSTMNCGFLDPVADVRFERTPVAY